MASLQKPLDFIFVSGSDRAEITKSGYQGYSLCDVCACIGFSDHKYNVAACKSEAPGRNQGQIFGPTILFG